MEIYLYIGSESWEAKTGKSAISLVSRYSISFFSKIKAANSSIKV